MNETLEHPDQFRFDPDVANATVIPEEVVFVHINTETTAVTTFLGICTLFFGIICNVCVIMTVIRTKSLQVQNRKKKLMYFMDFATEFLSEFQHQ